MIDPRDKANCCLFAILKIRDKISAFLFARLRVEKFDQRRNN